MSRTFSLQKAASVCSFNLKMSLFVYSIIFLIFAGWSWFSVLAF